MLLDYDGTVGQRPVAPEPFWYKSGVIYEVHVRSFHDGDGDEWIAGSD